jgi:predicted alpha/beta hydrolase family esterase
MPVATHDLLGSGVTLSLDEINDCKVGVIVNRKPQEKYSAFEDSEALAKTLGAKLVDAGFSGHINSESGHGPWPEGLVQFAAFLKML